MSKGNANNKGWGRKKNATSHSWAMFDALPKDLRDALNHETFFNKQVESIHTMFFKKGYESQAIINAIKAHDLKKVQEDLGPIWNIWPEQIKLSVEDLGL